MEVKSNGANKRCDSHRSITYRSSQLSARPCPVLVDLFMSALTILSHAINIESIGSRYFGSLLKRREITFGPRTLHRVYKILHIARASGYIMPGSLILVTEP